MSLAARLDRLRAVTNTGSPVQPPRHIDRGMLSMRPDQEGATSDTVRLADALEGCCVADGLIMTERVYDLGLSSTMRKALGELPETFGQAGGDWVYLDTETTGLSGGTGTLAFMVGIARYDADGRLLVRQYSLASFAAEHALLDALSVDLGDSSVLVTYNGRGFDLPLLCGRFRLHSIDAGIERLLHLDLMYTVRRVYRSLWPDCRLQTAERLRLDLQRVDDLSGALAPLAWQDWLRCGATSPLSEVLRHNLQDVLSLARLHAAMVEDHTGRPDHEIDRLRVGRAWQSAGCLDRAIELWSSSSARSDEPSQLALAAAYRRQGRWSDAEAVWMRLHRRGSRDAALALSKYHEHRRRDYARAMRFAEAAGEQAQAKRRRRLQHKLARSRGGVNLELPLVGTARRAAIGAQPAANSTK